MFKESLQNLDDLATVLTANKLRMSDDERLKAIDGIFADMEDKLEFLRYFNNKATVLAIQRARNTRTPRHWNLSMDYPSINKACYEKIDSNIRITWSSHVYTHT